MRDGIYNARIDSTFLGWDDHGLFVLTLHLDYGDAHQGYQRIIGTKQGDWYSLIGRILRVLDVESWEELPRKYVRAEVVDGLIRRIGHITHDTWTPVEPPRAGEGGGE